MSAGSESQQQQQQEEEGEEQWQTVPARRKRGPKAQQSAATYSGATNPGKLHVQDFSPTVRVVDVPGFDCSMEGPVAVTAEAVQKVKEVLSKFQASSSYYILRVTVDMGTEETGWQAEYRAHLLRDHIARALKVCCSTDLVVGTVHVTGQGLCLGCLSPRPQAELLQCATGLCSKSKASHTNMKPENLERVTFQVVVESGPHDCLPDLAEPEELKACSSGFVLPHCQPDLTRAARSQDVEDLLLQLKQGLGTIWAPSSGQITALHLAALTGDPTILDALLVRAGLPGPHPCGWLDSHGRTPLHYAALLDVPEVARRLVECMDSSIKDRWGRTAFDLASSLGNHHTANVLAQSPPQLSVMCGQRVQSLLRGQGDVTSLGQIQLPDGLQLADCVPLHDFPALRKLAELSPGSVDSSKLLRSMSCMECWYADLMNCHCTPGLPECMSLTQLFASPPTVDNSEDKQGSVLAPAPQHLAQAAQAAHGKAAIADRATFLARFHRRTGGVLKSLSWKNVMAIGGMVLACLTADDEEYARSYAETDVDLYVVGLSGEAFRKRVADVVSVLPPADGETDFYYECQKTKTLKVADWDGFLVIQSIGSVRTVGTYRDAPKLHSGDAILEVSTSDYMTVTDPEDMREALKGGGDMVLKIRPREAMEGKNPTATLLRTPQTLTSCIRGPSGQRLPNVQVVLAPYSSPAHLLFTTDIDCTAMGFDGKEILATPRAVEALSRRRNIVRPEKYSVRGEWRTEARLLKYAARGFRAVDLGLQPSTTVPKDEKVGAAAKGAAAKLQRDRKANVEDFIQEIRQSGVYGAQLLLQAAQSKELRQLMLHEVPKIRAGMQFKELVELLGKSRLQSGMEWFRQQRENGEEPGDPEERGPVVTGDGNMVVDDGYGMATTQLLLVNPSRSSGGRIGNSGLRGKEIRLGEAVSELDLESDRFEVRGWYDGVPRKSLQHGCWELDPAVWRGVGDFRSAA